MHAHAQPYRVWNPAIWDSPGGPGGYELNEINHTDKDGSHMISLACGI